MPLSYIANAVSERTTLAAPTGRSCQGSEYGGGGGAGAAAGMVLALATAVAAGAGADASGAAGTGTGGGAAGSSARATEPPNAAAVMIGISKYRVFDIVLSFSNE